MIIQPIPGVGGGTWFFRVERRVRPGRITQGVNIAGIRQVCAVMLGGNVVKHGLQVVFAYCPQTEVSSESGRGPGFPQGMIQPALDPARKPVRCPAWGRAETDLDLVRGPFAGDRLDGVCRPGRMEIFPKTLFGRLRHRGMFGPCTPGIVKLMNERGIGHMLMINTHVYVVKKVSGRCSTPASGVEAFKHRHHPAGPGGAMVMMAIF